MAGLASVMLEVLERRTSRVRLAGVMLGLTVRKEALDYLLSHPAAAAPI